MNNHEYARMIIKQFSGQDNMLVIPRAYIDLLEGDYHAAVLLNQIIYWSDKTKRTDGYFYKSYLEWEEELLLNEYVIRKSTKKLVALGIVETALKKANGAPTVHYKINMHQLSESILQNLKNPIFKNSGMESLKSEESLTENTTKISTTTAAAQLPLPRVYEELHFIRLTNPQVMKLLSWFDDFGGDDEAYNMLSYVAEIASDKNRRSYAFVESVLKEWSNAKVNTLAAAKAYEGDKFTKPSFANAGAAKPRIDFDSFKD